MAVQVNTGTKEVIHSRNGVGFISPKRRNVSLEQILAEDYTHRRKGDYIEVNVVHSFLVETRYGFECRYIFADRMNHISAFFYCTCNLVAERKSRFYRSLQSRLKECTIYRIKYFDVQHVEQGERSHILVRGHTKWLRLRDNASDIEEISEGPSLSFINNLPFRFTRLDEVGENRGKSVDLLAYVTNVELKVPRLSPKKQDKPETVTPQPFPVVQLVRFKPNSLTADTAEKGVCVALSQRFRDKNLSYGCIYAFSNISVVDDPSFPNHIKFSSSESTIIVEVSQDTIMKVAPSLLYPVDDLESVRNIDDLIRRIDRQEGSEWDSDENENLSRIFSQGAKLTSEYSNSNEYLPTIAQLVPSISPNDPAHSPQQRAEPPTEPLNSNLLQETLATVSALKRTRSTPSFCKKLRLDELSQMDGSHPTTSLLTPEQFRSNYNFVSQTYPYDVSVVHAREYSDIKGKAVYHMRSKVRGMALIVNNFFSNTPKERQGSDFDVKYLNEYLAKCGFDVTVERDVKSLDLKTVLNKFKERIRSIGPANFDCLFVAVSSHGNYGAVEMADEAIVPLYDDIVHQFDEQNFSELVGKPKVFVVNTCQTLPNVGDVNLRRNVMTPPQSKQLENLIVCSSTCPGSVSYRDTFLGSYFIYVLVDILMKHSHKCHFEKMLRKVQDALANVRCSLENVQLTCTWNTYKFKKLYFNPGL